jgi:hypothetical protein
LNDFMTSRHDDQTVHMAQPEPRLAFVARSRLDFHQLPFK